jgi:hypothetical protein
MTKCLSFDDEVPTSLAETSAIRHKKIGRRLTPTPDINTQLRAKA